MQNKPPKYGPWGKVNNSEKNRRSLRERHRHGENHQNYLDICHCSWMPRHMPGMQYLRFNMTEARWPLRVLCRLQECTQQEGQHRAACCPSLPAPGQLPQLNHLDCAKPLFSITPNSSLAWASVSFSDYWVFLEFQEGQMARIYRPSHVGKFNVLVHPLWPWVGGSMAARHRLLFQMWCPLFHFSYGPIGLFSASPWSSSWFIWAVSLLILNWGQHIVFNYLC